jgi:hypothetical protein
LSAFATALALVRPFLSGPALLLGFSATASGGQESQRRRQGENENPHGSALRAIPSGAEALASHFQCIDPFSASRWIDLRRMHLVDLGSFFHLRPSDGQTGPLPGLVAEV